MRAAPMATMTFSIPDDLEVAFNSAFEGEDKNAVLTGLMRQAIAERERRRRPGDFVARMRHIQALDRPVGDQKFGRARQELRD